MRTGGKIATSNSFAFQKTKTHRERESSGVKQLENEEAELLLKKGPLRMETFRVHLSVQGKGNIL